MRTLIRRLTIVGLFLIPLVLYLKTASPTINGYADSAELATAAYKLWAAHPPGYPLFVFLGHLATRLPFGSVAFRLELLVAVTAAASVVILYYLLKMFANSGFLAAYGALLIGLSPAYWRYSHTVEVYALNMFFITLLLLVLMKWRKAVIEEKSLTINNRLSTNKGTTKQMEISQISLMRVAPAQYNYRERDKIFASLTEQGRRLNGEEESYPSELRSKKILSPSDKIETHTRTSRTIFVWFVFLVGLSLANHQSVIMLFPTFLFIILMTDPRIIFRKKALLYILPFAAGLTPYLFIFYLSFIPHQPGFGNLPDIWRFLGYITRSDYGGPLSAGVVTPVKENYFGATFHYYGLLISQFTPVGFIVGTLGLRLIFLKRKSAKLLLAFALSFLLTGVVIPLLYYRGINIKEYHVQGVLERFGLLSFYTYGIIIFLVVTDWAKNSLSRKYARNLFLVSLVLLPVYIYRNFRLVDESSYRLPEYLATNILNQVPEDALIFSNDDFSDFMLMYFSQVEGIKPGVKIISLPFFSNEYYRRELLLTWGNDFWQTQSGHYFNILRNIIKTRQNEHQIYFVGLSDPYPYGFAGNPVYFTPQGLLLLADKDKTIAQIADPKNQAVWDTYNLDQLNANWPHPFQKIGQELYRHRIEVNTTIYEDIGCFSCVMREYTLGTRLFPDHEFFREGRRAFTDKPDELLSSVKQANTQELFDQAQNFIGNTLTGTEIRYERAIYNLTRIIDIEPRHAPAHEVLGDLYYSFSNFSEALSEYREAFAITPTPERATKIDKLEKITK